MELTKEYFDQALKDLATKKDLANLATKKALESLSTKDELNGLDRRIDGLSQRLDRLTDRIDELPTREEYKTLQTTLNEVKETVGRIDKRDLEDSDAFAKDILDLKKRVATLERQLGHAA